MNAGDQPVRVVVKVDPGIEREAIAKGESFQLWRKTLGVRHRRVVDQDRNNRNAALQSAGYFEPNKSVGSSIRRFAWIAASAPFRSDDRDDHFGALQGCLDVLSGNRRRKEWNRNP